MLAQLGRHEEGLSRLRRAHRLSPRAYVAGIAVALFSASRYQEALAAVEPVLTERPNAFAAAFAAARIRRRLRSEVTPRDLRGHAA